MRLLYREGCAVRSEEGLDECCNGKGVVSWIVKRRGESRVEGLRTGLRRSLSTSDDEAAKPRMNSLRTELSSQYHDPRNATLAIATLVATRHPPPGTTLTIHAIGPLIPLALVAIEVSSRTSPASPARR